MGERGRKEENKSKMRFLQLSILLFFHLVNFQPLTFVHINYAYSFVRLKNVEL